MTSEPIRDPRGDHLLAPQNCALVIIDYQPTQITSIRSMDQNVLVDRVVHLARFGMLYRLPIVLSTVNVTTGRNQPTIASTPGRPARDHGSGPDHDQRLGRRRVQASGPARAGRRKLIMAALWTEACLTFPSLDAMREGYETYPVTDAVWRDITRGAPGRAGPHRPGRRQTDQRVPGGV